MLPSLYGKDQHGLRARDLDHLDRQNFDAVEHIVSASDLLSNIPDAIGTMIYIKLIGSVIDSYLDKSLCPEKRLEELWYATFFLRYWREWLVLHPSFNVKDNFITNNAYLCVEINAHALLAYILLVRDVLPDHNVYFVPWMLGSQTCEKIFRSLRSMTSTYSTSINFSILGLLQGLHKWNIQNELQSQSESFNGIIFPRIEKHSKKDGNNSYTNYCFSAITNEKLYESFKKADHKMILSSLEWQTC